MMQVFLAATVRLRQKIYVHHSVVTNTASYSGFNKIPFFPHYQQILFILSYNIHNFKKAFIKFLSSQRLFLAISYNLIFLLFSTDYFIYILCKFAKPFDYFTFFKICRYLRLLL